MKYLLAYILPLCCFIGLTVGGWMTFLTPLVAFGLIPMLELVLQGRNHPPEPMEGALAYLYDVLVYLHVPVMYFLLYVLLQGAAIGEYATYEIVGSTVSVGIILGSFGMNLGHELGHRSGWFNQLMANLFWLPNLYMHFGLEHNLWHHKYVATKDDPASAPEGMSLYKFWVTSVVGNVKTAWKVENMRLARTNNGLRFNGMKLIIAIEIFYLGLIGFFFGIFAVGIALLAAIVGFLLLESVNYIEHYGLRRHRMANGRYEPLGPQHAWNSNHDIGRILLYELTRHSDHHMHAMKKYQTLESLDGSPQLPYGYPASILLAFFPWLWKSKMGAVLDEWRG